MDGRAVRANHQCGRLSADERLLDRAGLLASMGETFGEPCGGLPAGLADPFQAALTLVRASDRVTRFSLELDGVSFVYSTVEQRSSTSPG